MSDISNYTSVFRTTPATGQRVPARRKRWAVSCVACRSRKLGCDRQQPCAACVKRGNEHECRYSSERVPATTKQQSSVKHRVDRSSPSQPQPQPQPQPTSDPDPAARPGILDRLRNLEQLVGELAGQGPPIQLVQHVTSSSSSSSSEPAVFPIAATNSAYHGATHWAAVLDHIREIQTIVAGEGQTETPSLPTPSQSASPEETMCPLRPDIVFGYMPIITIDDVMRCLPSRQDVDKLVSVYFNNKFFALPLIHVHQFQRQYEAFWADPSSSDFLWISMLLSVTCIAVWITRAKACDLVMISRLHQPGFYANKSKECLVAGQYLTDRKYAIEALVFHAHSRNVTTQDSNSLLWAMFGLATRLAQRSGYHRDASCLPKQVSPFDAEMRRRVWFCVETFDLLLSFQQGMPSIVNESECDVGDPGNYLDGDFDEDTVVMPPARSMNELTPMQYYGQKGKICRLLKEIIRHTLSAKRRDRGQIETLDAKLHQWRADLPLNLRIRPIRTTSFDEQSHTIMNRLVLEMMYRKALCLLHRTYLTYDKENMEYEQSRYLCRTSALKLLELHSEFDQETKPGGRLFEDSWMLLSLTSHIFMNAAMLVCLDLHENKTLDLNQREKSTEALRTAHRIWTERAAFSEDAKRASLVLEAMLNRLSRQKHQPQSRVSDQNLDVLDSAFPNEASATTGDSYQDPIADFYDWADLFPNDHLLTEFINADYLK